MNFKSKRKKTTGSSMVFVIAMSAAIMVSSVAIFNSVISNDNFTQKNVSKFKASYEAEGVVKSLVNLTKQFVAQTDQISTSRLTLFITPSLAAITPPGYALRAWGVVIETNGAVRNLPSGPFFGMQSEVRNVSFNVTLASLATGVETSAELAGELAGITFTQFGIFSFYAWGATSIVNRIIITGRVFANDGVYIGSSVGSTGSANLGTQFMSAPYLASAAGIYNQPPIGASVLRSYLAADSSGTNYRELKQAASTGCVNCENTGLNWKEYALERWNGRVVDASHGVPRINIKTTEAPRVQPGVYGPNIPERMLIDPVVDSEPASVKQAKFSYKADIRIINGVWYLRNPNNAAQWPGIPVWSDHPGSFRTWNEETTEGTLDVGQTDIANFLAANFPQHSWPANTRPKKFSYYEYNTSLGKIEDNSEGVVSYGNLAGASGAYRPGGYVGNNLPANLSSFCYDSGTLANTSCTNCGTGTSLVPIDSGVNCQSGSDADVSHRILNATRSGFRFGLWQAHTAAPAASKVARSKVYPMNFDLARFQEALGCTYDPSNPMPGQDHRGELGCYFKGWGMMGRAFNGIVFISNTWDGSLNGLKNVSAPVAPPFAHTDADSRFYGSSNDNNQAPISQAAQSRALPMQLCSTSLAGNNMDSLGNFRVPNCNLYRNLNQADQVRMRTTALRLVNGANLSRVILPNGLSIVSNLHVYIQGDLNTSSDTSSAAATPWVPLLIAGDDIIYFSNSWTDHNARWDVATNTLTRTATNTTYNMALMKYWPQLLLNENWSGRTIRLNGPQILSHYSIYPEIIENYSTGTSTWVPPSSEINSWDPHFQYILNQPPGVPFVSVFGASAWKTK